MLGYFNNETVNTGSKAPPSHPYLVSAVVRNLNTVKAYYSTAVRRVASNHPLVSLIKAIGLDATAQTQEKFVDSYKLDTSHSGTNLGFTTSYNPGKSHSGVFYNGECYEYIYMYTDRDYELAENLSSITPPVVVLDHGKTVVGFSPPYANVRDDDTRACFITINLTGLMDMYWLFCKAQDEETINPTLTVEHFVAMYVIPYMVESQTSIAIINRLLDLDKAKFERVPKIHSFNLPDLHSQLDWSLGQILSEVKMGRADAKSFFTSIPSFLNTTKTAHQELSYPKGIPPASVNSSWFLTAARMRLVDSMIKLDCREGGGVYSSMINDYLRTRSTVNMKTVMKAVDLSDQRSYRGNLCSVAGVQMFD